ncbi:MAG: enoyl-CoA hydratase/isomerase family protein [Rhodospirillaceae bacterium]|nr:enoyl-CoA hydratase/isomerase family protein [Rhodospirillaceae bacterium]
MGPGLAVRSIGDLLEIVLQRPERRNALGAAEWSLLEETLREAAVSPDLDYVVLRAEGDFFCSGVDLALIDDARNEAGGLVALVERNGRILRQFEALPQFTIAALNGPAVGAGVHLALCADFVTSVANAYLWIPEAKLGIPDVLHYSLVENRLGRSAALAMCLLGERLSAADALRAGIIGDVAADAGALAEATDRLIRRLRDTPRPVRRQMKRFLLDGLARSAAQKQVEAVAAVQSGDAAGASPKSG